MDAQKKNCFFAANVGGNYRLLRKRDNGIDPQMFFDFYEARGWKYSGGTPMKNWKVAIRTWEHRQKSKPTQEDSYRKYIDHPKLLEGRSL